MKISGVDLYGSNGKPIVNLSFQDPASLNPYIAKTIVGLDAEEIISRYYGMSTQTASKYYELSISRRDIVLRIVLNPDFRATTYGKLRDDLYRMISATRTGKIDIRFRDRESHVAHITGFITKFEAPQFTETPEVQITVACDDPMIRGIRQIAPIVTTTPAGVALITDDLSTAPHGFKFDLTFTAAAASFVIKDQATPEWTFTVTPGGIGLNNGFIVGDHLYYSSEYGTKTLYIVRAGATIYLVDKIAPNSTWPIIFPGDNFFDVSGEAFTWNSVTYYPAYWGI